MYRHRLPAEPVPAMTDQANAFMLEQLIALTPQPFRDHFDACRQLTLQARLDETGPADFSEQVIALTGGELAIYGAGSVGRALRTDLEARGVIVTRFVDRDERLWGTTIDAIPVCSLEQAIASGQSAFIIGSHAHGDDITRTIREAFAGRPTPPTIFSWSKTLV
jgi:hypothetical protein